jgi:cytochrome c-type biogenesis protein CcmE
MDPARKRTVRLVVALTCALLLAVALVYTSFSASSEARQPSQLASAAAGKTYQLTGTVAKGTWRHHGTLHTFRVEDRKGGASVPVRYRGSVPDPFREGREIVVDVRKEGSVFVGQPDSLVTKCPSKFTAAEPAN